MNISLYGMMCMNRLHFLQSKLLHEEEKIMKGISKTTFKNITRYNDYSQIEYTRKNRNDSSVYVGVTILELKNITHVWCIIQIPSTISQRSMLHYMDTDSFVLNFTEDNVPDERMDLSNVEKPIKTN